METVAKVEHLTHVYSTGVVALKDVSLELHEKEIVAIIGQNGSGKTTLSKHFNGLLRPTEGVVEILGKNIAKTKVSEIAKKVGYVFQNANYQIFCATVRDEVRYGLKQLHLPESEIKARSKEVLARFELTGYAKKQPVSLSSGTKKLVALAGVYAMDPQILILDEPTTGQDYPGRKKLGDLMQELKDNGKTILVISHDMDFVANYTQRVIVMANGVIIKDGTPEEVFSDADVMEKAKIAPPQTYAITNYLRKKGQYIPYEKMTAEKVTEYVLKGEGHE